MAEQRYERVKELSFEPQEECPVQLEKGVILLDNTTGKCILQLKLLNSGAITVRDVHIAVQCLDEAGNLIDTTSHAYPGISAAPSVSFGGDRAIDLGSGTVKDVRVTVERVTFNDKTVWPKKWKLKELWRSAYLKALIPLAVLGLFSAVLLSNSDMGAIAGFASGIISLAVNTLTLCGIGIGVATYAILRKNGKLAGIRFSFSPAPVLASVAVVASLAIPIFNTIVRIAVTGDALFALLSYSANLLYALLAACFVGLSTILLLKKKSSNPQKWLSVVLMVLLLIMTLVKVLMAIRSANITFIISSALQAVLFALFALVPEKTIAFLAKVFNEKNSLAQIGLAVLTAYILTF